MTRLRMDATRTLERASFRCGSRPLTRTWPTGARICLRSEREYRCTDTWHDRPSAPRELPGPPDHPPPQRAQPRTEVEEPGRPAVTHAHPWTQTENPAENHHEINVRRSGLRGPGAAMRRGHPTNAGSAS